MEIFGLICCLMIIGCGAGLALVISLEDNPDPDASWRGWCIGMLSMLPLTIWCFLSG